MQKSLKWHSLIQPIQGFDYAQCSCATWDFSWQVTLPAKPITDNGYSDGNKDWPSVHDKDND